MALDLWFREDVTRILASAHETMRASTGPWSSVSPKLAATYQQGFVDALRAVGIAFGVAAPGSPRQVGQPQSVQTIEAESHSTQWDRGGGA
jgi:hypothetical protein